MTGGAVSKYLRKRNARTAKEEATDKIQEKGRINMGKNSTISPEVLKIIKTTVDEAVKKAANAIMKANIEAEISQRNYFKETERLLYSLPALKLKVAQDEEDLKKGRLKLKERSKDIVRTSYGGGSHDPDILQERYIQQRVESMERTKQEIQRIERALETIQEEEYYYIIPFKYWNNLSATEIAERLNCDERTYYRHKNRLVNKLKVVLFGADAI